MCRLRGRRSIRTSGGTALCEPPCCSEPRRGSSAERRLRDSLGSWSDHSRIMLGSFILGIVTPIRVFILFLEVQNSWQAQHFANLHVQISWQAQHFVNLHVQISWQAQHCEPPCADFVAGAALCEPPCADFVAGATLCEPPCADFVAGTALCEPPCADFVAGTALCEPPCADFVAGTALCEPPCADCVAGAVFEPLEAQHFVNLHAAPNLDGEALQNDGCETVPGHGRIILGSCSDHSFSESSLQLEFSFCFLKCRIRGRHSTL